jgi:hypothetical protein
MTTMKRVALLLFAGLFGLATLQTATAQDEDDLHDVTIEVDEINELTVDGAPTIDIGENIDEWRNDDDAATYDVETNVQDSRKITVSASGGGDATVENYGLRVSATAPGSGSLLEDPFVLTDVTGSSGSAPASSFASGDFITGFQQVGESGLSLTYEAKVNYEYNPSKNAKVEVTYTLTSN